MLDYTTSFAAHDRTYIFWIIWTPLNTRPPYSFEESFIRPLFVNPLILYPLAISVNYVTYNYPFAIQSFTYPFRSFLGFQIWVAIIFVIDQWQNCTHHRPLYQYFVWYTKINVVFNVFRIRIGVFSDNWWKMDIKLLGRSWIRSRI